MDPSSFLKNELFRPLASIVLPGTIALAPFAIALANAMPEVRDFYDAEPSWFLAALIGAGVVMGMFLENIGSSIERGIDRCMELEYLPGHDEVWSKYLNCGTVDNNGRRFLSSTVTRLKFLNSFMPALFLLCAGLGVLQWQTHRWSTSTLIVGALVAWAALWWAFRMSVELSEIASTTRFGMLSEAERPPTYKTEACTVRHYRHFGYVLIELATSRASEANISGRRIFWVVPITFVLLWKRRTELQTPPPR